LVAVILTLIYSHYSKEKRKDFTEITGKVSGISIDVRELKKERLELINSAPDTVAKLDLLQSTVKQENEYTIPLPEVQVLIEQMDGPNKFVGISELSPLTIKLPTGIYRLSLKYSDFKILDENYNLADFLKLSVELSGNLNHKTVIMMPAKREENI
jgi:hypothetical protein